MFATWKITNSNKKEYYTDMNNMIKIYNLVGLYIILLFKVSLISFSGDSLHKTGVFIKIIPDFTLSYETEYS